MAWSYRKRITIAPGVRLNISKGGVSTSFGVRGASITTGKNGTYLNTGIPGTGIYNRQKIGGSNLGQSNLVNSSINANKDKKSANGCGIFAIIILLISFFIIINGDFDNPGLAFLACCAGVVVFGLLWISISAIVETTRKPSVSTKKEELLFQSEIESARKALSQTTDSTKVKILENYISCLELNKKAEEIEPVISALKQKIEKKSTPILEEQLIKYEAERSSLDDKLAEIQIDVDKALSDQEKEKYKAFCERFEAIMSSEKAWVISSSVTNTELKSSAGTLVDRKNTNFYTGVFDFIKSEFDIPILTDCKGITYYLYPQFIIKATSSTSFDVFPVESVEIKYRLTRFVEAETVPSDSKVLNYTYQYVNQNGGPDRRYAYNPQRPVVGYGSIEINKFSLSYQVSNAEAAEKFVEAYKTLQTKQPISKAPVTADTKDISEEYFNMVNNSVERIIDFYNLVKDDAAFQSIMRDNITLNIVMDGVPITTPAEQVRTLFWADIIKCYTELGHPIDFKNKEGLGLLLFMSRTMGLGPINYSQHHLISDNLRKSTENFIKEIKEGADSVSLPKNKFIVSEVLGEYNTELQKKYFVLLYRFASIAAKADGYISDTESKWLGELLSLSESNIAPITINNIDPMFEGAARLIVEHQQGSTSFIQRNLAVGFSRAEQLINQLESAGVIGPAIGGTPRKILISSLPELDLLLGNINATSSSNHNEEKTITDKAIPVKTSMHLQKTNPHEELQSLVGLDLVKSEIATLVNYVKIQQAREAKGLKSSQLSYHCVFTGNPGTGKTTVARIIAEIYKDLGLIKKGHLIETDRSGLVAEYVGQTAVKTNKIVDSALDGVLFIDEAYSLISDGGSDYGKEAIATLLKRMEDNRDRLVVILAGYTNEMKKFIDSNPGLQSRFNRYIDFADYSDEELYKIFELNLKKFEYTISDEAKAILKEHLREIVCAKDCNFGNARFVRNLFEKTLEQQANRLATEPNLTTEKLSEICREDMPLNCSMQ